MAIKNNYEKGDRAIITNVKSDLSHSLECGTTVLISDGPHIYKGQKYWEVRPVTSTRSTMQYVRAVSLIPAK